jgi:integrase/recombinase XerD
VNKVTYLAPLLEAFFTERLMGQRDVSSNTIESYSTAFELLLAFAHEQLNKAPAKLLLEELDAPFVCRFLDHLESDRGNKARTRNVRLAAIHSFFHYVSFREPRHSALIQRVLDIPTKRWEKKPVDFLKRNESDALLQAPDLTTRLGRRDRALMALMVQTGLRVSETIGLRLADVDLNGPCHVRCSGKGRKQRLTPITAPVAAILRDWTNERKASPKEPLFPNSRDRGHLSRDAVEYLLKKHAKVAQEQCPSLADKRVTPHVLRHTCAMDLLQSGVDLATIALWLGHESLQSTQCYIHADLELKQKALEKTAPFGLPTSRYRPDDSLMSFLEGLKIMPSQLSGPPHPSGFLGPDPTDSA